MEYVTKHIKSCCLSNLLWLSEAPTFFETTDWNALYEGHPSLLMFFADLISEFLVLFLTLIL